MESEFGLKRKIPTGRVSKHEWLATALEALEEGGIDAVRVERLAKTLGVAKAGFYWHFKDLRDLRDHLLDYWYQEYTEIVRESPQALSGEPKQRLERIMKMIQDYELNKYDLAMHAWAQHDVLARAVVERVVATRFSFLRKIFAELGFTGDELEMRTMLFVCYQSWETTTFSDLSPRKRARLRKRRLELLTSKPKRKRSAP